MVLLRSQGNGNIFIQALTPAGWANGDLWYDTTALLLKVNKSGVATTVEMTAHKHTSTTGDGGVLDQTSIMINMPLYHMILTS